MTSSAQTQDKLRKIFCSAKGHNSQPISSICLYNQCKDNQGVPVLLCKFCMINHSNHETYCINFSQFMDSCEELKRQRSQKKEEIQKLLKGLQTNSLESVKFLNQAASDLLSQFSSQQKQSNLLEQNSQFEQKKRFSKNNDQSEQQTISDQSSRQSILSARQSVSSTNNFSSKQEYQQYEKKQSKDMSLQNQKRPKEEFLSIKDSFQNLWLDCFKEVVAPNQQINVGQNIQSSLLVRVLKILDEVVQEFNEWSQKMKQKVETKFMVIYQDQLKGDSAEEFQKDCVDKIENERLQIHVLLQKEEQDAKKILLEIKEKQNLFYQIEEQERQLNFKIDTKMTQAEDVKRNFNNKIQSLSDKQSQINEKQFLKLPKEQDRLRETHISEQSKHVDSKQIQEDIQRYKALLQSSSSVILKSESPESKAKYVRSLNKKDIYQSLLNEGEYTHDFVNYVSHQKKNITLQNKSQSPAKTNSISELMEESKETSYLQQPKKYSLLENQINVQGRQYCRSENINRDDSKISESPIKMNNSDIVTPRLLIQEQKITFLKQNQSAQELHFGRLEERSKQGSSIEMRKENTLEDYQNILSIQQENQSLNTNHTQKINLSNLEEECLKKTKSRQNMYSPEKEQNNIKQSPEIAEMIEFLEKRKDLLKVALAQNLNEIEKEKQQISTLLIEVIKQKEIQSSELDSAKQKYQEHQQKYKVLQSQSKNADETSYKEKFKLIEVIKNSPLK